MRRIVVLYTIHSKCNGIATLFERVRGRGAAGRRPVRPTPAAYDCAMDGGRGSAHSASERVSVLEGASLRR